MAAQGRQRDRGKERFWRQVLRQWRRSGQGVRDFCQGNDLSEALFYAWRRTIQERDRQAQPRPHRELPALVPVTIMPPAPPLEVVLGQGRVVRITPPLPAATPRRPR